MLAEVIDTFPIKERLFRLVLNDDIARKWSSQTTAVKAELPEASFAVALVEGMNAVRLRR
jgi:hypothetical protein